MTQHDRVEKHRTVLVIIAPDKFRDEELGEPITYFRRAGIGFDLVSTRTGLARGMLGDEVLIEKTIADVQKTGIARYDAVMIVGGSGSIQHLWDNQQLKALIKEFNEKSLVIGAICLSPVVLARAGVLHEKKATVFIDDTAITELKRGGAEYTPKPVVVDGNIVTANGPQASGAFAEKIVRLLTN